LISTEDHLGQRQIAQFISHISGKGEAGEGLPPQDEEPDDGQERQTSQVCGLLMTFKPQG